MYILWRTCAPDTLNIYIHIYIHVCVYILEKAFPFPEGMEQWSKHLHCGASDTVFSCLYKNDIHIYVYHIYINFGYVCLVIHIYIHIYIHVHTGKCIRHLVNPNQICTILTLLSINLAPTRFPFGDKSIGKFYHNPNLV